MHSISYWYATYSAQRTYFRSTATDIIITLTVPLQKLSKCTRLPVTTAVVLEMLLLERIIFLMTSLPFNVFWGSTDLLPTDNHRRDDEPTNEIISFGLLISNPIRIASAPMTYLYLLTPPAKITFCSVAHGGTKLVYQCFGVWEQQHAEEAPLMVFFLSRCLNQPITSRNRLIIFEFCVPCG